MLGRDEIETPVLVDLRDAGQVERFRKQVALLRELGVKEFTDVSGRKIVLFETGSRGFPTPEPTE